MKRFHVHIHVDDLDRNIAFYSAMFGAQPARVESDYAKWMLDDPAVNFAISTRGQGQVGLDHLGFQVDNEADLAAMKAQAEQADMSLIDEGQTTCCYARSDKHWLVDPQGLPWEHFRTLGNIPVFREGEASAAPAQAEAQACCTPKVSGKPIAIPVKSAPSRCC